MVGEFNHDDAKIAWTMKQQGDHQAEVTVYRPLTARELLRLADAAKEAANKMAINYGAVTCVVDPDDEIRITRHTWQHSGQHHTRLKFNTPDIDSVYLDKPGIDQLIGLLQAAREDLS